MSGQPAASVLVCLILSLMPQVSIAQEQEDAGPPVVLKPAAGEPRRVGEGVTPPVKISGAAPVYTELARKAQVEGPVILESIIDEQGDVTDVRVLQGLPMGLDQAAVEAVRTWKFQPATFEGKLVKVYFSLTVNFQVDRSVYRGPTFQKFLTANVDFANALKEMRFDEAAQLLDRRSDPESALARIYLLLAQGLLDDACREALRYEGADRKEALVAVAFAAQQSAQVTTKDAAARAQALELGLEAATAAMEADAKSADVIAAKATLLDEKARQTIDPGERQPILDERQLLARRLAELLRAKAANEKPATDAEMPLLVGGEVTAPQKISGDLPASTESARKARVYGVVNLLAVIDERGAVTDAFVAKGLPMGLDRLALEAIKTWKFEPATQYGKPVKVYYPITIPFPETQKPQGERE